MLSVESDKQRKTGQTWYFQPKTDYPRVRIYLITVAWPWPWPRDLHIRLWPRYYKDEPAYQNEISRSRQSSNRTDRHRRDWKYHGTFVLQVVTMSVQHTAFRIR